MLVCDCAVCLLPVVGSVHRKLQQLDSSCWSHSLAILHAHLHAHLGMNGFTLMWQR